MNGLSWRIKFPVRKRQRAQEVVATLALSLCKLRGLPPLSEDELDALMTVAVPGTDTGMATTGAAKVDRLIACLDGLIRERGASRLH